jgi:CheY-like chemotaxis protein
MPVNISKCALLIDDDEINNLLCRELIRNIGVFKKVQFAQNGVEGLDFIIKYSIENQNHCPELIMIDVDIPGTDIYEFLNVFNEVKFANTSQVKVIVLSNTFSLQDFSRIAKPFSLSCLEKPLTVEKILSCLQIAQGMS